MIFKNLTTPQKMGLAAIMLFPIQSAKRYAIAGLNENGTGAGLAAGVPVKLQAGEELPLEVTTK